MFRIDIFEKSLNIAQYVLYYNYRKGKQLFKEKEI